MLQCRVRFPASFAREAFGCSVGGGGPEIVVAVEAEGVDAGFVLDDWVVGFDLCYAGKVLSVIDTPASYFSIATGAEDCDGRCGCGDIVAERVDC